MKNRKCLEAFKLCYFTSQIGFVSTKDYKKKKKKKGPEAFLFYCGENAWYEEINKMIKQQETL